jgi:type I restriction enzyme S subunit
MTELPKGWEVQSLSSLVENPKNDIVDGPFGSNLKRSDFNTSGVPVLKIQNIKPNEIQIKKMDYVSPLKAASLGRHNFVSGDVIMTKLGAPLGVSAIVGDDLPQGVIVADLVRIRPGKVNTKFLCYQLNSPLISKFINESQKGTTRPRVNLQIVRNLPIAVPPIEEQNRIVETLDDYLSKLDKVLAEIKAATLQTATFRRSLLEDALFGDSSLPWTTLVDHIQTRKNKGIPSQEPIAKYLGLEHVESHGGRVLSFDSAGKYKSASPIVEQGDLLYGRLRPYLNKVVLAPERLYVSGEFIVMMPSATLDSLFLKHLLMSPRFLAFTALLDTGDRPRVSWEKIANFEFQLPELALQKQIVERIESSLVVAGSLHADLEQLGSQIATLRRALLQSAFSGNMRNG